MKFLSTQISYFLKQNQTRQNINALLKYLLFLLSVIAIYTVLFHFLMFYAEGRDYSWITGLYWTLTVMSTLGFGDITFASDIGRAFSILVLLSGIVLLLIMLPFAFIRFFYAPWIEAQIHTQTPREVPTETEGHVIICRYDTIAPNLIKRLKQHRIPYFVIESDPAIAAQLYNDDISVIQGEIDSRVTYERLQTAQARLVFANADDAVNTNITLTVREVAPDVPVAATAANEDSIDILELSGATRVLPLKHDLGEQLANRISVGSDRAHIIGNLNGWVVAEFTVHDTPLKGLKIRETKIRELSGVSIIGIWERGRLLPAAPDMTLTESSVPVGVGTREQIEKLDEMLAATEPKTGSVLILGGGKVGRAAALSLKKKNLTVFIVDCSAEVCGGIKDSADRITIGDAADRETLMRGGLREASLVILSTNNDAVNIFLSIYCRRLKPDLRIVSRITHERNLEAIHRAGADFVLSYAPLGAESVMSLILGRAPVILGEGIEMFKIRLPARLAGKTLEESRIGSLTGLIVLGIHTDQENIADPHPSTVLPPNSRLSLLGTGEQLEKLKMLCR
jgi:Trk K+ transport system NAD-binding subunit